MHFEKPKLFPEIEGFWWLAAIFALLILLRHATLYFEYREFVQKPFYYTNAKVLSHAHKTKNHRSYTLLKLQSDEGQVFYTTTYKQDAFKDKHLRLQIFPATSLSFWNYIGTFYVKSRIKKIWTFPPTFKRKLFEKVASQHVLKEMTILYNAIFFAAPLEKTLREKISLLGISHLVALSGFHLGILWSLVYGSLLLFYKPLQQKFFPYRYALFDVGIVTIFALGFYVWFVDAPPSLVRAYAMVLVGWVMLLSGVELLSFTFLAAVGLLLLALFPSLLVSVGFWLSVVGVFYIFLLLHYTKSVNKWILSLLVIPLGVFVLMLPIVHSIFGVTTVYQLLSPLLSLLFVPFYPLVMLLHLFGYGGVLDAMLWQLFNLPEESNELIFPLWVLGIYLLFSLAAIRYTRMFYMTILSALVCSGYLFLWL